MLSRYACNMLQDNHSYPVVMAAGGIQELIYINGNYFDNLYNDVSDKVDYITIFYGHTPGTI